MSLRMDCPECGLIRYAQNKSKYEHLKDKPCQHCRGALVSLQCANCGKNYKRKRWEVKDGTSHAFCCQMCYFEYKGKVKTSTKERLCIQCGEEFKPAHKTNKFCSRMCFGAYRKRHPISIIRQYTTRPKKKRFCISCGNETIKSRKYCDSCRPVTIFVRTYPKMKECAYCHNMFDTGNNRKRVYCSRKCYGLAARGENHPKWNGGKESHVCTQCGKEYDDYSPPSKEFLKKRFCGMACKRKWFREKNHPAWLGEDYPRVYPPEFSDKLRKRIRDKYDWRCVVCGDYEQRDGVRIPVHHIDWDKSNSAEENLCTVCSSCHSRIHHADIRGMEKLIELIGTRPIR